MSIKGEVKANTSLGAQLFRNSVSLSTNDSSFVNGDSFKVLRISSQPREGKLKTSSSTLLWLYLGHTVRCPQCQVYYHQPAAMCVTQSFF